MSMPWFPFWVDDFLASPKVRSMTMEEVGVYMMLLCEQWQNGFVAWPSERKANALQTHPDRIEYVLGECFQKGPEGWENHRLRQIKSEQTAKSEKAKRSAEARWGADKNANALQTQSGRNANQNQNQNQKKKEKRKRKRAIPSDWKPTESHVKRCDRIGIDVEREAMKFRAHAEGNGRMMAEWNSAFTTWLMRAEEGWGNSPRPKDQTQPALPLLSDEAYT